MVPSKKVSDAVEDFQLAFSHSRNIIREKPTAALSIAGAYAGCVNNSSKSDYMLFSRLPVH